MANSTVFAFKSPQKIIRFSAFVQTLFQNMNYTLLNNSTEVNSLFSPFQVPFQKIYAENFSNLLSAQICSALSSSRQCATNSCA